MPLPRSEYDARLSQIRALLLDQNIRFVVVSGFRNFWRDFYVRYLTNYDLTGPMDMLLLPAEGEPVLLISDEDDLDRARSVSWVAEVQHSTNFAADAEKIARQFRVSGSKIGFAGGEMMGVKGFNFIPTHLCESLRAAFPGTEFVQATDLLDSVRVIKSEAEKALIRRSGKLADLAMETMFKTAGVGVTEREIFSEVWWALQREGCEDIHCSITTGMPNYWIRPPTDRVLKDGDLLVIEICPRLEGYFTQTIKMAAVGHTTLEYEDLFEIEREAKEKAVEKVRPGERICELVKTANDIVKASGIGTLDMGQKVIRAGHAGGIGLDESPELSIESQTVIHSGMSLIVHPVAFFPYLGSVFFIGDHIMVTDTGFERVTSKQDKLVVV